MRLLSAQCEVYHHILAFSALNFHLGGKNKTRLKKKKKLNYESFKLCKLNASTKQC